MSIIRRRQPGRLVENASETPSFVWYVRVWAVETHSGKPPQPEPPGRFGSEANHLSFASTNPSSLTDKYPVWPTINAHMAYRRVT